ncbi:hypothetical protein [Mycobacterium colombiense]|uniref:hypothetical protein n=1 Tax=Mycobacterium colombiense TaxID=339268 RepID=UPI001319CDD0|nr:hypothetical protein [Mycobacterium colombiense]
MVVDEEHDAGALDDVRPVVGQSPDLHRTEDTAGLRLNALQLLVPRTFEGEAPQLRFWWQGEEVH